MAQDLLTENERLIVKDARAAGAERLSAAGIAEADLKVEWLLARLLHCNRLELPLRAATVLTAAQRRVLEEQVSRLANGEPLQYVLADVSFRGLPLRVDRRVLIPRPETEELVELLLRQTDLWEIRPAPTIVDVGTGCGAIVLALAASHPDARFYATDISPDALELAQENAKRLNLHKHIRFLRRDLLNHFRVRPVHAIVANLPYVPTSEWEALDRSIRDFEPRIALDGGPDGLALIARLIPQAFQILAPSGILLLEIGEHQGTPVLRLLRNAGFARAELLRDMAGRERFVLARK